MEKMTPEVAHKWTFDKVIFSPGIQIDLNCLSKQIIQREGTVFSVAIDQGIFLGWARAVL